MLSFCCVYFVVIIIVVVLSRFFSSFISVVSLWCPFPNNSQQQNTFLLNIINTIIKCDTLNCSVVIEINLRRYMHGSWFVVAIADAGVFVEKGENSLLSMSVG